MKGCFLLVSFALVHHIAGDDYVVSNRRFPKDFKFGTASAAYQIEGGWNADGKGENIWDRSTHLYPEKNSYANGDVACDSYNKWQEDVELLKGMGVSAYRFSIAWSRVLPTGFVNSSNPAGIAYYKNLIAALKANNIEPLVTMHHWDIPTVLEDLGGFLNSDMQEWFLDYARFLFETFGEDIKDWVTFNEPKQTCGQGYGTGELAPNMLMEKPTDYMKLNSKINKKKSNYEDIEAAERNLIFTFGWFGHPINFGDYPEIMKERIANRSLLEGFETSRLPSFTEEEKRIINGTADFICVNIYTSSMVNAIPEPEIRPLSPTRDLDIGTNVFQPDYWEPTITSWFKVVPWGARKLVNWISNQYGHPEIMVTENGYHDNGTVIHDMDTRGRYHKLYLSNLQDALYKDGVNLTGYMAWALTDDFEWQFGYNIQLGLYQVNFTDPDRPRTPKDSSKYYRHVVTTRCLLVDEECID
ncbi:hypothetical protein GWI33_018847 [Rhynchophorus ferrugineus]|uniref:Myrosinase 1-like n=1 Tax=Rhynchophorus ferrugineus TaxID=354439 RepID=A0A834M130_RHYFE|nr:hypothetical protein GWI33_018847 [Rhynchophorus ferrugineus]